MTCDLLVGRVIAHGHVGVGHDDRHFLAWVVRCRGHVRIVVHLGRPLAGASGAPGRHPFVVEQHLEIAHVPFRRRGCPRALEAAADLVAALAAFVGADPAQAHLLHRSGFRLGADVGGGACAVAFAEGVAAGGQRQGFVVVHRHAREGLAHHLRRDERIGLAARAFGVDVDQAHLHCGEWILEFGRLGALALVIQPLALRAPVHGVVGFPLVGAATGEAEGLEAHALQRHVAGQHDEVGPREFFTVFLLDRPQQAARLIEVDVVGPAVERGEALLAMSGAAAAVADAIGPRRVPGHADEQRAVVAVVGRPPVLRVGHQRLEILDHGVEIEALERFGVVEVLVHRIGQGRMLVQHLQVELVGPPVAVRRTAASGVIERALRFG
ncbi:hypothetical protein GALL_350680 [mine drainage metagenome]|uniref:Uncharacterized protein n=1 Tax=mine drainage metagenome TaxID=410659 RepID=A0A1J5QI04_9ZZZZ